MSKVDGIAIMAIDPGGKSGLSWGWFSSEAEDVGSAVRRALRRESLFAREIAGDPWPQALVLARAWMAFRRASLGYGLTDDDIYLVCEDFQLRQRSADLAPVSVIGGLETLLCGKVKTTTVYGRVRANTHVDACDAHALGVKTTTASGKILACVDDRPYGVIEFQGPSAAKGFATNDRLRAWGAWVVGSEHMRDAMRHLCLKLSNELS